MKRNLGDEIACLSLKVVELEKSNTLFGNVMITNNIKLQSKIKSLRIISFILFLAMSLSIAYSVLVSRATDRLLASAIIELAEKAGLDRSI